MYKPTILNNFEAKKPDDIFNIINQIKVSRVLLKAGHDPLYMKSYSKLQSNTVTEKRLREVLFKNGKHY